MVTSVQNKTREAKYLRLADELRVQVSNGILKPGDRLPSFVELSASHQISRGTIEKVHALLERDGLIVREQGKGVFVAKPVARLSTGIIGFKGGGFSEAGSSLYWANMMEGLHREAANNDLQLMLLNDNLDDSILENLDGILLAENEESAYLTLARLPEWLPRVSLMTPIDGLRCVLSDDYQGSYDATRHLLQLGHRRIGVLCAGRDHLIENRLLGYQAACHEFGVEPALSWVRQLRNRPNSPDSLAEFTLQGRNTIEEWFRTNWNDAAVTAILAQNDHAAVGAIEALRAAGLNVPGDISVAGFDGTEMYCYYEPKLTTVAIALREIGAASISILLDLMRSDATNTEHHVLPTHLIIGESTGPVKSDGTIAAKESQ